MPITIIKKQLKDRNTCFVEGSAATCIGYVWPLTAEVAAIGGKYDVEQRLQRHVVRIIRRKS
jgi:hypothetical protein